MRTCGYGNDAAGAGRACASFASRAAAVRRTMEASPASSAGTARSTVIAESG